MAKNNNFALLGLATLGVGAFLLLKKSNGEQEPPTNIPEVKIDFATAGISEDLRLRSDISVTNIGTEHATVDAWIDIDEILEDGSKVSVIRSKLLPTMEIPPNETELRGITKVLSPLQGSTGWFITWEVIDLGGNLVASLERTVPRP